MKIKTLGIVWTLCLAALVFVYLGCEKRQSQDDRHGKHGIILWADIDKEKWEQIKGVLHKDPETPKASKRSALFRLRRYDPPNPPVDEEGGELCDALLIDADTIDQKAKDENFKGHAMQIGLGAIADFQIRSEESNRATRATPKPTPTPERLMPHAHYPQNIIESRKMVEEVNKILDEKTAPKE